MWASEVQNLDVELLPKIEEKELFRTFCEDFNTATLPHKKYYNLAEYQQKKAARAAKHGSSDVSGSHLRCAAFRCMYCNTRRDLCLHC